MAMLAKLTESQTHQLMFGFFNQRLKRETLKGCFKESCCLIGRLCVLRPDWFRCRHQRKLIIAGVVQLKPSLSCFRLFLSVNWTNQSNSVCGGVCVKVYHKLGDTCDGM